MLAPNRLYQEVGNNLKELLLTGKYQIGDRLPTERDIADLYGVSRTVVREALIMLELENLISVKKGSGVYVTNLPGQTVSAETQLNDTDYGPFELLQARQLIESSIAGFAASQVVKSDIIEMRMVLDQERRQLERGNLEDYSADELFHILIARATKNAVLESLLDDLWQKRNNSKMWKGLHSHIHTQEYRKDWLKDHESILQALQVKDSKAAKQAMWQHLENVKNTLMELSNTDDPNFDGYLFESVPAALGV